MYNKLDCQLAKLSSPAFTSHRHHCLCMKILLKLTLDFYFSYQNGQEPITLGKFGAANDKSKGCRMFIPALYLNYIKFQLAFIRGSASPIL